MGRKISPPLGFDFRTVQPVASRYTDYAVPAAKKSHTKVQSKVHPITVHKGPEVEYSSTLSLTSALGGDGWSTPRSGRFSSGKDPVPIV